MTVQISPTMPARQLEQRLKSKEAFIGIIGLGYVGLPLAAATARAGLPTIGFDVDQSKVDLIHAGKSYIDAVKSTELAEFVNTKHLDATVDFNRLAEADVIIICVPTPLTKHREPDLSYVEMTVRTIAKTLREGQLVVLESTTWPGTTLEVVKPILEETGLKAGLDFFVGFSPEREDPGNAHFQTATIPKVVSGDGPDAQALAVCFYQMVVQKVVPVTTPSTAEAVKIVENVFRSVNIALVNELKVIFDAMNIDVWEVIEAASSKPFGFMPFYPGPGLGGHCIPIDPFYLSWKAREFEKSARFIELAGEINISMPAYVVEKLVMELDRRQSKALGKSNILVWASLTRRTSQICAKVRR